MKEEVPDKDNCLRQELTDGPIENQKEATEIIY
jgi:hypothetical protein